MALLVPILAAMAMPPLTRAAQDFQGAPQGGECTAEDNGAFLQVGSKLGAPAAETTPRITISREGKLVRGAQEVLPLGGNYIVKAQPYFPPRAVVRESARSMAEGVRQMQYVPSDGRQVVPVVRLGTLFEAAMPEEAGAVDRQWAAALDETIEAFAEEGVYVFLDVHQDAFSTTNGGEGMPHWIASYMQRTARPGESFVVSPEHPMEIAVSGFLENALRDLGIPLPQVRTMANDTDPWRQYAVGANSGDPRFMNVGNLNVRLNNNDVAWSQGTLLFIEQVQNYATRFYNSHKSQADRSAIFTPFVSYIRYLCRVWERHSNVIAVELLNEPPFGGLPNFLAALGVRPNLFGFYAEVLRKLDRANPPIRAPIAFEDLFGSLPDASPAIGILFKLPWPFGVREVLTRWARRSQLILSFHYYPGFASTLSLSDMVQRARSYANWLGPVPTYLSEYHDSSAQVTANMLAEASEFDCSAVTYWHNVDMAFTQTEGWFRYPTSVGTPVTCSGEVNSTAWAAFEPTVRNGSFWGAAITGACGGHNDVLRLAPAASAGAGLLAFDHPAPSRPLGLVRVRS